MAERLFGTDGVRGIANGDLTAELALALGAAAARRHEKGCVPGDRRLAVDRREQQAQRHQRE